MKSNFEELRAMIFDAAGKSLCKEDLFIRLADVMLHEISRDKDAAKTITEALFKKMAERDADMRRERGYLLSLLHASHFFLSKCKQKRNKELVTLLSDRLKITHRDGGKYVA